MRTPSLFSIFPVSILVSVYHLNVVFSSSYFPVLSFISLAPTRISEMISKLLYYLFVSFSSLLY